MDPIYLPTHKLDIDQLAKWSFDRSISRYGFMATAFGILIGLETVQLFGLRREFGLPVAAVFLVGFLVVARYRLRNEYASKDRGQLTMPRTLVLDGEGCRFNYQNGATTLLPWSSISGARVDEHFVILMSTSGPMFVPRNVVTDDALKVIREAASHEHAKEVR